MFGVEGTDNLHFAVYAKQLGAGLDEQLEKFIREHPDTRLIIIDTLQKIREVSTDAYSYANDYDIVGSLLTKMVCACSWCITHASSRLETNLK